MSQSGGWQVFLFLFILGVACQSINQMGIWNVAEPNMQYSGISQDQINQTQNSAVNNSPVNIFVVYTWIVTFMTIIGSGILAVFSVGTLFYGMGWPVGVVGAAVIQLIQLPANIVVFFWLFELWTGR